MAGRKTNQGWFRTAPWPLRAAGLVAIVLLAYIPAMRAEFVWDDSTFFVNNPLIHADDGLYRFWCTTEADDYFPLTSTALWAQWRLFGENPAGYHIVNILLHALAVLLLWRVLRKLAVPGAWAAAAIFGVHPVAVESVAWITEMKNTLPMVFFLTSIWAYLHFEDRKAWWAYAAAVVAFAAALLAKTSVAPLPLILLLLAWWRRGRLKWADVWRTLPFFALAAGLGAATVWFQSHNVIGGNVVRPEGWASRIAAIGWMVWFYLYKLVLPMRLTAVYPRWDVNSADPMAWIPLAALAAVFVAAWLMRKQGGRHVLVGLGYYVLALGPVLGLVNMAYFANSLVADHFQYLAMPGPIALIVGVAAAQMAKRPAETRRVRVALAAAVIVLLGALTWKHATVFRDNAGLWTQNIRLYPKSWVGYNNLGILHAQLGTSEGNRRAFEYFSKTIELNPGDTAAYANRGAIYLEGGNIPAAVNDLTYAIRHRPTLTVAWLNRAECYQKLGRNDLARRDLQQAIRLGATPSPEFIRQFQQRK